MTITELGRVLLAMASVAHDRGEYYARRPKPAPAAEAISWTLRAILMAGASKCNEIAKENENDQPFPDAGDSGQR